MQRIVARPLFGRAVAARSWLAAPSLATARPALIGAARSFRTSRPALVDVRIPIAELHAVSQDALLAQGYSHEEAAVLLDVAMWSQLRGAARGHGVAELAAGQLPPPAAGRPGAKAATEYETKLSARIDGEGRAGMLVMRDAVDVAVEKAKANGVGLVGTRNLGSAVGALGYYLQTIADAGLVGLVFSHRVHPSPAAATFAAPAPAGSAPAAAPPFEASPLGVSVPSPRGAVVLDMATAVDAVLGTNALGGSAGAPAGAAAATPLGRSLEVFDKSYQGSHLSVMVELLAGPLVGASAADGNLVLAFDPELLGDREGFQRDVEAVLQRSAQTGRAGSAYPGEAEAAEVSASLLRGHVDVDDAVLSALRAMASTPAASASGSASGSAGGYRMATRLAHPKGKGKGDPYNASSPVLYQTATFELDAGSMSGEYDYTRSGNPTRHQLEEQMADLEGASRSFAFTSGMAALAVAMRLVPAGGHIVTGDDIYGGTSRLLANVAPASGLSVSHVDMCDIEAVRAAMTPQTKLVWLESPTNPRMQITDIGAIARIAKEGGALSIVDNSIMAPVFQQPLALGADISMTSATKFVAGHSDVTAGILSIKGDELADRVYALQNSEGGGLSPFDCWLCLRGLKTMSLRMERQQANCVAIAHWLASHPAVRKINYPGLPTDPSYGLQMRQASGGGSLLSFETGNVELSKGLVRHSKLFKVTVSFGSTSSLVSLPCFMSHASIPKEVREARGLPDDLVRISAGIEAEEDLLADLAQAMARACDDAGVQLAPEHRQPPVRAAYATH